MVVYPVIPKGKFSLRLIPTALHTLDDVAETIQAFEKAKVKLDDKVYVNAGVDGVM